MKIRKFSLVDDVTTWFACAAAFTHLTAAFPVAAQINPSIANVVPDGGEFAARGKIQALDTGAGLSTAAPL
jgi:hypothetical protein